MEIRLGVPSFGRNLANSTTSFRKHGPKLPGRVDATRKPAADANYGDWLRE
jgi:hypothetical protein